MHNELRLKQHDLEIAFKEIMLEKDMSKDVRDDHDEKYYLQ